MKILKKNKRVYLLVIYTFLPFSFVFWANVVQYIITRPLLRFAAGESLSLQLCFQGIKITRCRFSEAECAACSNRFWFPAENMRSFACFADCSFQRNKDFVMIYTAKVSVELQWSHLFCGIMNPTLYCSALPQGRVHWITLPDLFCGIMSARDCNGFAERKRTLKRRLTGWRALECPQEIVTATPRGRPLRWELTTQCCKILKKPWYFTTLQLHFALNQQ